MDDKVAAFIRGSHLVETTKLVMLVESRRLLLDGRGFVGAMAVEHIDLLIHENVRSWTAISSIWLT